MKGEYLCLNQLSQICCTQTALFSSRVMAIYVMALWKRACCRYMFNQSFVTPTWSIIAEIYSYTPLVFKEHMLGTQHVLDYYIDLGNNRTKHKNMKEQFYFSADNVFQKATGIQPIKVCHLWTSSIVS
jgi:hypothetical protein